MRTHGYLALVCLFAVGCSDGSPDSAVPGFPKRIELGATAGTIENWFSVDIAGSAEDPLGTISFTRNVGTIILDGTPVSAFIYERQQFGLYQGFALGPDRWDVFWLYCQPSLMGAYVESIGNDPLVYRMGAGECKETFETTVTDVALPASTIPVPEPQPGFVVTGNDIAIRDDGTGTLKVADRTLPLDVFDHIDCSTDCGAPGWYALHALAWDDEQQ